MLSILIIMLVVLLLIADAFVFLIVGISIGMQDVVKRLKDKGWTIEPPGEGTV